MAGKSGREKLPEVSIAGTLGLPRPGRRSPFYRFWLRCVICVLCVGAVLSEPRGSWAAEPNWTAERLEDGQLQIWIPASGGKVSVATLTEVLIEVAGLDSRAVRGALPQEQIDLTKPWVSVSLAAINGLLGDGAQVALSRAENGELDGLKRVVARDQVEITADQLKGRIKQLLGTPNPAGTGNVRFGLQLQQPVEKLSSQRPLVILLHGYNAGPRSLAQMSRLLQEAGYACGTYCYPNDGPIVPSAAKFAEDLRHFCEQKPNQPIALLTHSMGGLVARAVVEAPEFRLRNVRQLIMVSPPSQGSQLARIPGGFDFFEHLVENGTVDPVNFMSDSVNDGLNEARWDLRPESPFLRELNQRPRNAQIRYSVILGTRGILQPDHVRQVQTQLDQWTRRSRLLAMLRPRLDTVLADPQELVVGQGDGVVSVSRGRLAGVDDVVELPLSHITFVLGPYDRYGLQLFDVILSRLKQFPQ